MTPGTDEWAEARAAFEAGDSARAIARRLGLHHSAVSRQAKRQGWAAYQAEGGGAVAQRRAAARPEGPDDEATARPDGPAPLVATDAPPPLDLDDPRHQRVVLDAATGVRRGQDLEDHLEHLAEDQREAQAERLGRRGPGWLWRAPF